MSTYSSNPGLHSLLGVARSAPQTVLEKQSWVLLFSPGLSRDIFRGGGTCEKCQRTRQTISISQQVYLMYKSIEHKYECTQPLKLQINKLRFN